MTIFDESELQWGQAGLPGTGVTSGEKTDITSRLTALEAQVVPAVINDLTDVDTVSFPPTDGQFMRWNQPSEKWEPFTIPAITIAHALPYTIDGGGVVIATGLKYGFQVNHGGIITGWSLAGNPAGAASVAVWKDTDANFPPVSGDAILTMTISATNAKNQATGLNIPFAAGDWFYFNVGSVTNFTILMASLKSTREVTW